VQPNLKSSAGLSTTFVSKNARGQSSPELYSQNERLWNGCLWRKVAARFGFLVFPNIPASRSLSGMPEQVSS
jgi:hypothetical protein